MVGWVLGCLCRWGFCSIWLTFCFAAFDCRGFGLLSISLALYRGCRTCGHPSPTELAVVTAVAIASLSSCRHFQGNFMSGEEAETPFRNSILGQICGRSPISLAADRRHHRYTMPVRYTQSTKRASACCKVKFQGISKRVPRGHSKEGCCIQVVTSSNAFH